MSWVLKTLPPNEMAAILALPSDIKGRYFISGYANLDYHVLKLYRGNGEEVQLPFSWFNPSGNAVPDFTQLEIIDHGQTVKLGDYEVSARSILYERDPEYKAYCDTNRMTN